MRTAAAVLLSLTCALTLAPALCATMLRKSTGKPKGFLRFIPAAVDKTRDGYVRLVRVLLKNVWFSLLIFVFAVAATVFMLRTTPTGFIPLEDKGVLFANVQLPDGASLQRSRVVAENMTTLMQEVDGVVSVEGTA